jgi:uncharacterized membrane protein
LNATPLARLLLVVAYSWMAHVATLRQDGTLAAIALADLVLIVLLEPLLQRRSWAWLLALGIGGVLAASTRSPYILLPLLLVPPAFVALVAWTFGRTLHAGRTPLITRIVTAVEKIPPAEISPELHRYTRGLTATWAWVLGFLAVADLALALCAVPGGLLHGLGVAPPVAISPEAWSWFANALTWGLVGGLFVGEYYYRVRRFPGRYTSFFDFLHRMAGLGPAFWRGVLREG